MSMFKENHGFQLHFFEAFELSVVWCRGQKKCFSLVFSSTKVLYMIEILLQVNEAYFSRNMISTNERTEKQK